MIICLDCKHGGKHEYCQSQSAVGLTPAQKRACYSSCAFFELPAPDDAEEEKTQDTGPGLFD